MLNKSGVTTKSFAAPTQILANVNLQASVGTVISQALGRTEDDRKIVYAGTPCYINFDNLLDPAIAEETGKAANGVVLHDVDVTDGNANGVVLYFGVINKARVTNSTVKGWLTAGSHIGDVLVVNM